MLNIRHMEARHEETESEKIIQKYKRHQSKYNITKPVEAIKDDTEVKSRIHKISFRERGADVLNSFLPDILKIKLKQKTTNEIIKDSDSSFKGKTSSIKKDEKVLPSENYSFESNKLSRQAIKNSMLEKLGTEVIQKSEHFDQPRIISHSASETTCNLMHKATKYPPTKRRSMSDYFDLKAKYEHSKIKTVFANQMMETNQIPEKQNIKGKVITVCERLPNTPLLGKANNDSKQNKKLRKNGNAIDKDYCNAEINDDSSRHLSITSKTITHFSKNNENKLGCSSPSKSLLENKDSYTHEQSFSFINEHKSKLSVHKLTPIPSVESDEFDENELETGRVILESEEQSKHLKSETIPAKECFISLGKGILKKNSSIESPIGDIIITAESSKPYLEIEGHNESSGEPLKKDGISGRMVKFDMPSFDSQISDVVPNYIVEGSPTELKSQHPNSLDLKYNTSTQTTPCNISVGDGSNLHSIFCLLMRDSDRDFYSVLVYISDILDKLSLEDQSVVSTHAFEQNELQDRKRESLMQLETTLMFFSSNINKFSRNPGNLKDTSIQQNKGETPENCIGYIEREENNTDIQSEDQIESLTSKETKTMKRSYSCPDMTQATSESQAFHFNLQDGPRYMKMEKEVEDEFKNADYSVASDKTSYTNDSYLEMDKETISRCFFGRETQI